MTGWPVRRRRGTAAELHGLELGGGDRQLLVLEATGPALVLGSTQRSLAPAVAAADPAVEVVVRRSGGGAVPVVPGGATWVDLWLPRGDALWDDDVGRSAWWVGQAWVRALGELGLAARVHRGPLEGGELGALACFAGLGPGEVVVAGASGGPARKVVGVAQRRTRAGARFQCLVLHRHDPSALVDLLAPVTRPALVEPLRSALADGVATVAAPGAEVVAALVAALPPTA